MSDGRVVILDRDGTVVVDRGYLSDPAGLDFLPDAPPGLQLLHSQGYRLVVITNQSGVGRGLFALERVEAMNRRLHDMFEEVGARLAGIYVCPHAPAANCTCRKPAQGLMLRAAAELNFDPSTSVVVGDKASDIEFGRHAGARTILISAPKSAAADSERSCDPDFIAADLLVAARWIVTAPTA